MKVKISELLEVIRYLNGINNCDLSDIELVDDLNYMDDVHCPIEPNRVEEWKFIGLSNKDFLLNVIEDYDQETYNKYLGL